MKVKPSRKALDKGNGYYKLESGCGKLAITIQDGADGYPIRVIVEPIGGGCQGGIEYLRRSLSYALECNLDMDNFITEVMEKIVCPGAKSKKVKNPEKEIYLSCSKAVAHALREHMKKVEAKAEPKTEVVVH